MTQSSRSLHTRITLKMIRKLSLFALLIVTACGGDHVGLTSTQQVYEVVMNGRLQDPLREIVILGDTEAQAIVGRKVDDLSFHIETAGNVPKELVADLILSASESEPLDWQPVMVNAKFVRKADISGNPNWRSREFAESFLAKYPDHQEFYALSDVAVSQDERKAVLLVSYFCPVMCGSGEFLVYLEKSGMQWSIVGSSAFWIT